jgi:NAD(P)-dependent dehydrogenase (short-subunit alcohol dehydrogenase family)
VTAPGRVALVTGAGRGIGEAIAVPLAADGWQVAVAARSPEALVDMAAATGALALPLVSVFAISPGRTRSAPAT